MSSGDKMEPVTRQAQIRNSTSAGKVRDLQNKVKMTPSIWHGWL